MTMPTAGEPDIISGDGIGDFEEGQAAAAGWIAQSRCDQARGSAGSPRGTAISPSASCRSGSFP